MDGEDGWFHGDARESAPSGALASVLAVAYILAAGLVLGYAWDFGSIVRTLLFLAFYGGLGAGIGCTRERYPLAAGVGLLALLIAPPYDLHLSPHFGVVGSSDPVVLIGRVGWLAVAVFLGALCVASLVRRPRQLWETLSRPDAIAAGLLGLTVAGMLLVVYTSQTMYSSLLGELLEAVRFHNGTLWLAGSVTVAVVGLTRRRLVLPAGVVGTVLATAVLTPGPGHALWSPSLEYLFGVGFDLLALVSALAFFEVAWRRGVQREFSSFTGVE